ncbi:MAG: O-antigen ligase family protein [Ktedonobacteraceae bacterium]
MIKGWLSQKSENPARDAPRWVLLILNHKEVAVVLIVVIHLYVDWYLGLAFSAQILTLGLLFLCYRYRSTQRPWTQPYALWLWLLWLVLALLPATQGISAKDSLYYYVNVFLNALLVFWLGLNAVQDSRSVRRIFQLLALFATLLAIITIIQARTGVLLFKTTRYDSSIDALQYFELGNSGIYRAEAFLLNPDSNGAFFALMLFLPLGLFLASASYRMKALYAGEMLLMLLALLFTYSTGAWLSAAAGIIFFIIFAGSRRYRMQIAVFLLAAAAILLIGFSSHLGQLLNHAIAADEWSLRFGVWITGLRVILAYPLQGIGLGRYIYIVRAEPYRIPAQFIPVYHPHNSYLELAALAGIPVALLFITLLGINLWLAVRNWVVGDVSERLILGGGLAAVLSLNFYSLNNAGWTLTPLLACGWLILGILASPALARVHKSQEAGVKGREEQTSDANVDQGEIHVGSQYKNWDAEQAAQVNEGLEGGKEIHAKADREK